MADLLWVGVGLGHLEVSTARATGAQPARQVAAFVTDLLPGPAVTCRPGGGPLPVTFENARPLRDGHQLGTILTRLREGWLSSPPPEDLRAVLAVPSGTPAADRVRCREVARRSGWGNVRVVGNDTAVSRARLGEVGEPVTTLIAEVDFDGLVLTLATVLGGVARMRVRLRLGLLSHRLVDELVLASCLAGLSSRPPTDPGDWVAMWGEACKVRRDLGSSAATAVELNASGWGGRHLVSVARDDLWPALEPHVEEAARAARELVRRSLAPREQLGCVLLVGGGVLTWPATVALLAERLGAVPEALPVQMPAVGAALLAGEPDDPFAEPVDSADPEWARHWQEWAAPAPRAVPPLRVEGVAVDAAPPSPAGRDQAYPQTLQGLWSYLRGVGSENPARARRLLEELRDEAEALLATLEVSQPLTGAGTNLDLERAEWALEQGRLAEAINASHDAHAQNPSDPAVFRRMVEIHVEAAKADPDHGRALNWLQCAHGHDQANAAIHRHLARRYREQAGSLLEQGQSAEALEAVRRSLLFEPLNAEARGLEDRLVKALGGGA